MEKKVEREERERAQDAGKKEVSEREQKLKRGEREQIDIKFLYVRNHNRTGERQANHAHSQT